MNISITDSASIALPYGRSVKDFLAERARPRHEAMLGETFFGDYFPVGNPATEIRAAAERPRAAAAQTNPPA